MTTVQRAADLGPTRITERITVIDILRGFAIFGILMVNIHFFANPWNAPRLSFETNLGAGLVTSIINLFFTNKFFSLFSFLFGLGIAIQMNRAEAKNVRFLPLYLRRLFFLALFGLAHGILIWIGDILFIYAVVGLIVVLLFRGLKTRGLLVWGIVPVVLIMLFIWFGVFSYEMLPEEVTGMRAALSESLTDVEAENANDLIVYGTGTYAEITAERAEDFVAAGTEAEIFIVPSILLMFLIGLAVGKKGVLFDIDNNLDYFRRMLWWTLPLGLLFNIAAVATGVDLSSNAGMELTWGFGVFMTGLLVGAPLLSLAYMSGIVLLTRQPWAQNILKHLAPVGRMALSNYLMHSIVCTLIFYGYGFGLFGQLGPVPLLGIVIAIYAVQIPISAWWLRRFRFGPFEWLWRSLTYMQFQPMRVADTRKG